jgi:hypothetical protein
LGVGLSRAGLLAELDAFFAARAAPGAWQTMPRLDLLAVLAVVVVVIDLAMLGRILGGVRVISRDFRHMAEPF